MKIAIKILFAITTLFLSASCINNGGGSATVNDLKIVSGISNHRLMLDGCEGVSTTFKFKANYDWKIIDYKGFSCNPSSGAKSAEDEVIEVIATPLQSNNSADTIRLSDLNIKMLSTRFVGISAYQFPQIRLPKGNKMLVNALSGSTATLKFVSSSDNIELITEGDITASLSEKNDKNEYTITATATGVNNSATNKSIGTIGFSVEGMVQESKIEVTQISAIVLDRSEVILPSKAESQNMLAVTSEFNIAVSSESDQFEIINGEDNTFTIKAKSTNTSMDILSLGEIEVSLKDAPDCKTSIAVKQRPAQASQTIIIHFIGTALQYYFNQNITKMLEALNSNIQGNAQVVVIYTDSTNDATLYELRYDAILGKAVKEKVKELSLPTPYNSALFEANIREALDFAPAERYALVVGSHGLGWIPKSPSTTLLRKLSAMGISHDELWKRDKNAEMTRHLGDSEVVVLYDVHEIASAIEANDIKLDYLLFDACYMGNIESAYELRNATQYIIGSPCEVMGYGFPYAKVLPYMLCNGETEYNLDKVCSEFVEHYRTTSGIPCGTVALTNCSELEALAQAMKNVNNAGIRSDFALSNVQYYDGKAEHSFYDLGDMVEQSCADSAVATAFKTQLDKTVTSRYHTAQFYSAYGSGNKYYHDINYYSGISTSAMVDHYSTDWQQTAWYKATH